MAVPPTNNPPYLFEVDWNVAGGGDVRLGALISRIKVARSDGWNMVELHVRRGFEIRLARGAAQRLKDDLEEFLRRNPEDTPEDWLRMAGYDEEKGEEQQAAPIKGRKRTSKPLTDVEAAGGLPPLK